MGLKTLFFVFAICIFIFVSAESGNLAGEINENYYDEDFLKGSLNISFDNRINENLKIHFSNGDSSKINVVDFIDANNITYTCEPLGCKEDYEIKGEKFNSKSFELDDEKLVGFELLGKGIELNNFELGLESDVRSSCENQLVIDMGDDGNVNWVNNKYIEENCGEELSPLCSEGDFPYQVDLDKKTYCDKFELPVAPAFKISADIERIKGDFKGGDLKGYIYHQGNLKETCDLTNPSLGKSECVMDYTNKEKSEHYVCVSLKDGEVNGNYTLSANLGGGCGFHWDPTTNPEGVASYGINAVPQKYSEVGDFKLNSDSFSKQNNVVIEEYIEEYLQEKYQKDCTSGCIVPLKISGKNQNLDLSNLKIDYDVQGGGGLEENYLFELDKTPAFVKTNLSVFDLRKGDFDLPKTKGNYSVDIFLGDNLILSEENLSVGYSSQEPLGIVRQIFPTTVSAARPTLFKVFIDPSFNESDLSYVWDFGEGEEVTEKNEKVYTFLTTGNKTVKVSLKSSGEIIGSKVFEVNIESPKQAINSTLKKYTSNLEEIKKVYNDFPDSYKPLFEDDLDFNSLETSLGDFKNQYKKYVSSSDTPDGDYVNLMEELVGFKEIPLSIQPTRIRTSKLTLNANDIKLVKVSDIFGDRNYNDTEKTKEKIVSWFLDNMNVEITRKVYSIQYPNRVEPVFSEFNVLISPKEFFNKKGYFMINKDRDNIVFNGNYSFGNEMVDLTGIFVNLSQDTNIVFAEANDVKTEMYFVPDLSLIKNQTNKADEEGMSVLLVLFLAFGGLLAVTMVIYYLLEKWYEEKYEDYLFKDKSNLKNLIYFIRNARKKRLSDEEIKKKLKNSRWSGEQIDYALKTYKGKDIGFGLSFLKSKESKKKK